MAEDQQINTNVVLTSDTRQFSQQMIKAQQSTAQTQTGIDKLINSLDQLAKKSGQGLMILSGGTVATLGAAGMAAAKFDSQLGSLKANAAMTDRSMQGMVNQVNRLRQDLPLTTENVISLVESLQKMGVRPNDMEGMVKTFTKLSLATGENMGGLATGMIQLQTSMGTLPVSTDKFSNTLAGLSANMGVSAQSTLQFANSIAPMARTVEMSQKEVMGFSAAFAKSGQDGFAASNVMTQLMMNISRASRYGTQDLEMFASVANMTTESFKKMSSSDQIVRIFTEINKSGPEAVEILDRMGFEGARSARAIQGVVQSGQLPKAMREAGLDSDAMNKGAAAAMTGMNDSSQKLRNSLAALASEVGGPLTGAFTTVIDIGAKATQTLTAMLGPISGLISAIGAIAAPVGGMAGGVLGNIGMITGGALALGLARSPMTAGILAARGRTGGAFMGPSVAKMQAGGGGPLQRFFYRAGLGAGGDIRGALGEERYGQATNWMAAQGAGPDDRARVRGWLGQQPGAALFRQGRDEIRQLRENMRAVRAETAGLQRGGVLPRMAMAGALASSSIGGFTSAQFLPLLAGRDITNRQLVNRPAPPSLREAMAGRGLAEGMRAYIDPRISAQPAMYGAGNWKSLLTGVTGPGREPLERYLTQGGMVGGPSAARETGRETLRFSHALKEATGGLKNFGGQVLLTAGSLGRMAGGGAMMAGGALRGAGSAVMGALGPVGIAMLAGGAAIGYVSQESGELRAQRERMSTNDFSGTAYNDYASAMGLAARAAVDLGTAMGETARSIDDDGRRVTRALREIAEAPGYEVSNKKLEGLNAEQAATYLESIYSSGTTPSAITQQTTLDLIKQFGDRAQGIIEQSTQGGLNPMSLYSGQAPWYSVEGRWRASGEQSRTLNELVLPTMVAQRGQAQTLYGTGSREVSQVTAAHVQSLAGQIAQTPEYAGGERSQLYDAIAAYLGVPTEDLGIRGIERGAINQAPNEREALARLLAGMKGSESYDTLATVLGKTDPGVVARAEGFGGGSTWASALGVGNGGTPLQATAAGRLPNLAMVENTGLFSQPFEQRVTEVMSTKIGGTSGAGILMGEGERTYAAFLKEGLGDTEALHNATERLLTDVGSALGNETSAFASFGDSAQNMQDMQGVVAALDDMKRSAGDATHPLYQLADAAQQVAMQAQSAAMARLPRMEQVQGTMTSAFQASNLDLSMPGNKERLEAAKGAWLAQQDWMAQYNQSLNKAYEDWAWQNEKQAAARQRQLGYQEDDFERQRSRAYANFNKQRARGEEDYNRSRSQSVEDFELQERHAHDDFDRTRTRSNDNFNRARLRQEADFQHQQVMMTRSTVTSMQDMYSRMTTQRSWDTANLLVNMQDQVDRMREQQENLTALREQGVSGDVISFLGLNNFQNQGQVARMLSDIMTDPALVTQLNESISGRVDMAQMFAFDPDSEQWKEMKRAYDLSVSRQSEDYTRSMSQGEEDFNRAMGRNEENFVKAMGRMDDQHKRSMDRQQEDFGLYMQQSADDFAMNLRRNEEEWAISLETSREALGRTFRLVTTDFNTVSKEALGILDKTTRDQWTTLSGALSLSWEEVMGVGRNIATEFPALLAPLFGGAENFKRLVGEGVFGNPVLRKYSDEFGPAGTTGNVWNRGAGDDSSLPDSDEEIYDRILTAQKHTGMISGGTFSGGKHQPLAGGYHVTSRFGMRTNPVTGRHELHNGTDLAAPTGTPIYSFADGVVSFAGVDRYSGNVVQVEHGNGMRTRYHHMSRLGTEVGATVQAGQVIGYVGSTGNSTGPHLHFSVFNNGMAVDSMPYLTGASKILGGTVAGDMLGAVPSKADVMRTIVQSQQLKDWEDAWDWSPLRQFMPKGRFSMMLGAHWAEQYNPGYADKSLMPENTDWYARGALFNSPRKIGVGESGPEAVIPLSGRGADFMAEVISKFAVQGAEKLRTAGRQTVEVQHVTYYQQIDQGNHFHGKIEAQADDPNRLISELERKARLARLNRTHH